MWPFRRNRDEPAPDAAPPEDARTASPETGEADVARAERAPTGDWMTMPAVRTAITPMAPTFRVQTLPDILTSHHDTRLSGSLGHAVSADAPSGTIGGLARTAGSNSSAAGSGTGDRPLREPFHPPEPVADAAPLTVRRLATSDAAPLSTAGASSPASLPEPAVSRVLANPGPAPSPASLGARPLPIARVVDAPAASAAPAPAAATAAAVAPSAPPPAAGPGSDAASAPLVGDPRVGGFEVDLESLLAPESERPPVLSPPPDLAPPIQRRVRGAEAPLPSWPPVSAPTGAASEAGPAATPPSPELTLPPIQRLASTAPAASPVAPSSADPTPTSAPAPAWSPPGHDLAVARVADDARGLVDDAPTAGLAPLVASVGGERASDSAASDDGGAAVPADLPLVAPASPPTPSTPTAPTAPVQRSAEISTPSAPTLSAPPPSSPTDASPAPSTPDVPSPTSGLPPATVQRAADDEGGLASLAPLLGGGGMGAGPGAALGGAADSGEAAESAGTPDLPLVSRAVDAPAAAAAATSVAETTDDTAPPDEPEAPATEVAPTLGTGDGGLGLPVQTLADASTPSTGPAPLDLPLAPAEQPGTLAPPTVSAPSAASAPTSSPSSPRAETGGTATAPTASAAGLGPAGSSSRPLAAQRSTSSNASTSSSAAPLSGGNGGASAVAAPPMTVLAHRVPAAGPVQLQRMSADGGDAATGALPMVVARQAASAPAVPSTVAAPVSTTNAGGGDGDSANAGRATSGNSGASLLPLHSAAVNVPSSTDLLVKAGLGERASDGSFLRSVPPAGMESSFTVQRQEEASAAGNSAGTSNGSTLPAVQRAVTVNEVSSSVSAPAGSEATVAGLSDADIRKLYVKIRAELDADLRRQLEAKNRNGRYRP